MRFLKNFRIRSGTAEPSLPSGIRAVFGLLAFQVVLVDRDELNPLIMIEAPRLMFPFARAVISDMTRDGGFMPLSIQPIDSVAVYQNNLERQQDAAAGNGADPEAS